MAHAKSVAFELEEPSGQSIFQEAIDEWLKSRSTKSKKPEFIAKLKSSKWPCTQEDVHEAIKQVEKANAGKPSTKFIRKTLQPVIRVLRDYGSIIDTLAQADPMPTSLIWGSLKAVISISDRFLELYETISSQLINVGNHIALLIEYHNLFKDSQLMRARLKITYVYIIQFWYRVEKECNRCVTKRLARSLASFSTSKLDDIVNKIEHAANEVAKIVPVVQERCAQSEREDAAAERIKAGISRKQLDDVHSVMLRDEKEKRLNYVRRWLQAEKIFESNLIRHQEHRDQRKDHTCEWLVTNNKFNSWLDSKGTEATIWVRAAPGFGKSVTCAFALEEVSTLKPLSACVYQYYSFDEQFEPVEVYRSLASQLISRLWTQKNDIPEEVYTYAQRSEFCLDVKDSQNMIKLLVDQLNDVFIFLDGLDEECNSSTRRSDDLAGVITFLSELTLQSSAMVHLWCSSQDKAMLRAKLGQFPSIDITGDTNGADIKVFLSKGITQLDSEDFDEGYKNLILEDLTEKTQGCFLWAAGMLDSIRHAESLDEVKQKIKTSLPEKIEDYYMQKLRRLDEAQKPSVALILSCIAFARRPLRLEELREITGIARIDDGQDALDDQKMFGKMIMKYCDQLVRVTDTEFENRKMTTCTLWHSTVRAFLTKYPEVLCIDQLDLRRSTRISEEMIANVCLKFLWQPSFRRLLRKEGDSFKNASNKNIKDQPLISYAAKYWDRHLDNAVGHLDIGGCDNTDSFCFRVQRFIHSPQFITCIQIQSLLVKGQFQFWWAANAEWRGPQIKRVFPRWLASECLPTLTREYAFFIGEWGEFLDLITSDTGPVPGEVDRCFWGALGPWHFLRGTAGRYNSFMLSKDHQAMYEGYLRYDDGFNDEGDEAVLLTLDNNYGQGRLTVQCQHWKLRDSTFEPGSAQKLDVNAVSFRMYDLPLKEKHIGRAPPVSFSQDLGCLRIGSDVFIRSAAGTFEKLQREGQDEYTEDVVYRHGLVALSRRNQISGEDLPDIIRTMDETSDSNDKSEFFADLPRKLGITMIDSENADESSSSLDQDWSTGKTAAESATATSLLSIRSSVKESPSEQEADGSMNGDISPVLDAAVEKSDDESEFALEAASIESVSNSATTVWSESSSRAESDIDEAVDWNDWDDRDNDLIDVESGSDNESASDQEVENMVDSDPGTGSGSEDEAIEIGSTSMKLIYRMELLGELDSNGRDGDGEDGEDDDGSEAASVQSRFSEEYFTGESDSDLSSEEGQRLDRLLKGEFDSKSKKKLTRIRLDVYSTDPEASDPVFRFSHKTKGALYSSPPVFHPSKRLLVWPLGDEQILFADIDNNSYFTRLLGCSSLNSCHVFVKAHFSADGKHLHFAALEAGPVEGPIQQQRKQSKDTQALRFNMQITTHRLSERKTTRAPPRLIHRVNLPLGRATRINVSDLPYELTWREKEVYVTIRDEVVRVARVPLFPSFSNGSLSERDAPVVRYNEKLVYLPRTAPFRSVRYFPPPRPSSASASTSTKMTGNKSSSKQEEQQEQGKPNHSLLILGSNCTTIAKRRLVARVQVSPPVGVWLDQERDLGQWQPRLNKDVDEELREKTARKTAGKLSDMWEKFDRTDDCDIVPYLY